MSPEEHIVPGVKYGRPDVLLSPAYWEQRCQYGESVGHDFISQGASLFEEVAFCLLGGFGVKFEICEAFYNSLKENGLLSPGACPSEEEIFLLLNSPISIEGRLRRYRFPRQRAQRISFAMKDLLELKLNPSNPRDFRDQLQTLPGIGPKTASWITRNWLGAENVAILDVHVIRAGQMINLFEKECNLLKDYERMESRFLELANALKVRASVLDAVIWSDMRMFGSKLVLSM